MLTSTLIQELMKANSAPAITPGLICGRVIRKNVCMGVAPKILSRLLVRRLHARQRGERPCGSHKASPDTTWPTEQRPEAAGEAERRCVLEDGDPEHDGRQHERGKEQRAQRPRRREIACARKPGRRAHRAGAPSRSRRLPAGRRRRTPPRRSGRSPPSSTSAVSTLAGGNLRYSVVVNEMAITTNSGSAR